MKLCKTIFRNPATNENIYQTFYGNNCDILAANYQSAHPNYILVSCEII